LRVHGRVQGVGFRAFVWRSASALGVRGWVRNRLDGTVEAVVAGSEAALDELLDRVREGPRWSRVDRIDSAEEPVFPEPSQGFEIRPDR
jgi:acylphosphatase